MRVEKPFEAMTKQELVAVLHNFVANSTNYYESKLSKERENVIQYYNGLLPKPAHAGNSKYVSLDVFDAVESMKAELLETFAAGRKIVSFDPVPTSDLEKLKKNVEQARIQTAYCDHVVFTQNDGYKVFNDVIQDGLMSRVGVVKVYWEKKQEEVEEEFSGLTQDELDALLSNPKYTLEESEQDDLGMFSGSVTSLEDKSQVRIEVLPPEEFLITSTATSIHKARFCAHRTRKSLSDLLKMGFDRKIVESLTYDEGDSLDTTPETLARFESILPDRLQENNNTTQRQTEEVLVYECYLELDMEGEGEAKLYKCTYASGKLLEDPEEVSFRPFCGFVPLTVTHSFYGSNYAAKVIPTQNARTVLTRSILDHTLITNNPRYMVVKGALTNPREMLENRLGGLVNVTRPDGIAPLPQASLNPFVFQTIQLLDDDKEETTGISKLSQGMNKDAVSKQNSAGMVEQLVSMSQKRQKIIARNFANQFVKQLYLMAYRLVNANETERKVVNISGNFIRIEPSEWEERTEATVELKLGYGEQEREAQKFLSLHQMLSQDPTIAPLYQLPNKYAMIKKILDKGGFLDTGDTLTHPSQVPPPQPDPLKVKELELQERGLAIQERQVQVGEKKVDMQALVEKLSLQMQQMKQQQEHFIEQQQLALKTFEVHKRVELDEKEMELAAQQDPASTKAILSPSY
jgi:hypothetical protein